MEPSIHEGDYIYIKRTDTDSLKAGDIIKVTCAFGCKAPTLKGMVFPYVGDVLLAPAGSEVATGYDNTVKRFQRQTHPIHLPDLTLSGLALP